MTYKQYVRLGETLSNGYKLVEVNRDSVLLTRGSDKLELELLDASKNTPQTARRNNRRTNTGTQMLQTLQNMQRMQMFQNMQMMRMMRQNQNPDGLPGQPESAPAAEQQQQHAQQYKPQPGTYQIRSIIQLK